MIEWIIARSEGDRGRVGALAGVVCISLNVLLCIAKALVGILSGSVSIVADALNNLSDASSNIVSVLGFKLASKPADPEHPYGHGRFEYLSGLVVAVLVLMIGVELVKSSIDKVLNPSPVEFSLALVVVLAGSMAVKL
ncbi:MAG: cation diffusion facilitator family transporter [Collinsella intestinalis]